MKILYYFLLADSVFCQFKSDPDAPELTNCPSHYQKPPGSNKCELDNQTLFSWTCNADASITLKNLHTDYLIENYSSNPLINPLSLMSKNGNCSGTVQQVNFNSTSYIFNDFTIQKSDLCISNFTLSSGTNNIIEYKITVHPTLTLPTIFSINVGCGFNKTQSVSQDFQLQSAQPVSSSGTSGGASLVNQNSFGASVMTVESLDPVSRLPLGTARAPIKIGQQMSYRVQIPSYLNGFNATMHLGNCIAKSNTPGSSATPVTLYQRVCPTPPMPNSVPSYPSNPSINFVFTTDANSSNNYKMTWAEMKFNAFYFVVGDVTHGVGITCDVTICSKSDLACKFLC